MSKEATENQDRVVNMKKQTQFSAREMRIENVQGQETSWQQEKEPWVPPAEDPAPFWLRSLTELVFMRNCLSLCLRFLLLLLSAYMHHSKQTNKQTHLQIEPKEHRQSSCIIASNAFMPTWSPHCLPFKIKETEAQKDQIPCPKS